MKRSVKKSAIPNINRLKALKLALERGMGMKKSAFLASTVALSMGTLLLAGCGAQ